MLPEYKVCKGCQLNLPADSFYKSKRGGKHLYLSSYCKRCHQDRNKETSKRWHQRNHERDAAKARECYKQWCLRHPETLRSKGWKDHLKQKYGITLEQYNGVLQQQEGKCALCKKTPEGSGRKGQLVIDHDHQTGTVRGLLCYSCNNMVAYIEKYPELLSQIKPYLELANKKEDLLCQQKQMKR